MRFALPITAALLMSTAPTFAQDTQPYRTVVEGDLLASEFIGSRIYSAEEGSLEADMVEGTQPDWEDLGEINDVVLTADGSVSAVLLDVGGFLGMGEKRIAVSLDQLRILSDESTEDPEDVLIALPSSREALEQAPVYDEHAGMGAAPSPDPTATESADEPRTATDDAAIEPVGDATAEMAAPAAMEREGYVAVPAEEVTVDDLTDAPIYDANDDSVGEIEDLVLGEDNTSITQVIIDVGGFLGLGAKPVALNIDDLRIMRQDGGDELRVHIDMTREQLEQLPQHEG